MSKLIYCVLHYACELVYEMLEKKGDKFKATTFALGSICAKQLGAILSFKKRWFNSPAPSPILGVSTASQSRFPVKHNQHW